jgi:hypothetical protein
VKVVKTEEVDERPAPAINPVRTGGIAVKMEVEAPPPPPPPPPPPGDVQLPMYANASPSERARWIGMLTVHLEAGLDPAEAGQAVRDILVGEAKGEGVWSARAFGGLQAWVPQAPRRERAQGEDREVRLEGGRPVQMVELPELQNLPPAIATSALVSASCFSYCSQMSSSLFN